MIRFNGLTPEMIQPGRVKVTTVGDRFAMQKNYQTVEQGGILRSYVTMPTVRNINAQFLVRARNQAELDLTLQHILEWLDCGEAKLQTREMEGVYYKAVYSEITSPAYSGSSCRFAVTFQCTDYRLFSENDDRPLSGTDPGTENFTFNGKHCLNDMDCMFVLDQKTIVPEIAIHKYEIPGRAGTLRYDDFADYTLGEEKISGSLYLVNAGSGEPLSFAEQEKRLHRIAEWLITAKRAPFIWDADPTHIRLAEIESEVTFSRTDWRNGKLSVEFIVQPNATLNEYHSYTADDTVYTAGYTTIDLDTLMVNPETGETVPFTADTPLHIEIRNTSSGGVKKRIAYISIAHYADSMESGYLQIGDMNGGGFALDPGNVLVIDTETRTAALRSAAAGSAETLITNYTGTFPYMAPSDPKILIAMGGYELDPGGTGVVIDDEDNAVVISEMNASVTVTAQGAVL